MQGQGLEAARRADAGHDALEIAALPLYHRHLMGQVGSTPIPGTIEFEWLQLRNPDDDFASRLAGPDGFRSLGEPERFC